MKTEAGNPSAVEWPTIQEAMQVKPIKRERDKTYDDDDWGGKVWDGVTDWFM